MVPAATFFNPVPSSPPSDFADKTALINTNKLGSKISQNENFSGVETKVVINWASISIFGVQNKRTVFKSH